MHHAAALLQSYFSRYGYWTIAFALLLENAGVPFPGETVLLFASFLAYSSHQLRLPYIILIGTLAATAGDNIGYVLGRWGGRWLLDRYRSFLHLPEKTIDRGERLFDRYGPAAIFFARFIVAMRVIAGPLAGVLRMDWARFATFNALGAATWVVTVSLLGYAFGRHWGRLVALFSKVDVVLGVALVVLVAWLWWRHSRQETPGERGE